MDTPQNFRSAFNGFNREDVVNYISFISTKHDRQLSELRDELEELRTRLAENEDAVLAVDALKEELAESREKCASLEAAQDACSELEQSRAQQISDLESASGEKDAEIARLNGELAKRDDELQQLRAELERAKSSVAAPRQPESTGRWEEELNAYRRAESCERRARERVNQMFDQASGALAEASLRVEQTVTQISELTAKVESDVTVLMKAMSDSEHTLADTAMMLGAIRPEME